MIGVDISNIWGAVSLPDLLAMEGEVAAAHETVLESSYWQNLPAQGQSPELFRILLAAERIREDSDICVVVGAGGCCAGARAVIELLQGMNRNLGKGKGNPQICFAGNHFSTRHWNELLGLLKDRDFSVVVISRFGTTTESAIALRSLRWMLERKYGTDAANRRIYAVTDPEEGALRQMASEEGWDCFSIPNGMEEMHCTLTAAGLLPMAVAGIDIQSILDGAADAKEEYAPGSFENPVWLYTAVRNLLYRGGKTVELLASFEPEFHLFGHWWQQLFAAAEGKAGKGILPAAVELPADLYSLGQLLQESQGNLFETMIRFDPPENRVTIGGEWKDLDGLNYLEGKTLDFLEENAYQAATAAHVDGGVPVITVDFGELTERKTGEILCFLELCSAISACLMGVDSTAQSCGNGYEENLLRLLGKPGLEA